MAAAWDGMAWQQQPRFHGPPLVCCVAGLDCGLVVIARDRFGNAVGTFGCVRIECASCDEMSVEYSATGRHTVSLRHTRAGSYDVAALLLSPPPDETVAPSGATPPPATPTLLHRISVRVGAARAVAARSRATITRGAALLQPYDAFGNACALGGRHSVRLASVRIVAAAHSVAGWRLPMRYSHKGEGGYAAEYVLEDSCGYTVRA